MQPHWASSRGESQVAACLIDARMDLGTFLKADSKDTRPLGVVETKLARGGWLSVLRGKYHYRVPWRFCSGG
ncbi:uncharacterized protein BO72DRAFT_451669 [Aspergillus fijiensis CBS 313.89]|uniref:Uncharacterized protein n=1 Tax=Aspergillus fijiensis CBS 313.89 TaxID=1448319 RepID=A0A8G1VXZ4_9EURO|nr:uncharacterized protein BO72DRAFT_451669 [Aspergillus fijiensis CBS 313.89]RAK73489.1 hypothetical protein BO72DRAFT_451669 [Aspergillus fijiensis CBS 313.89]